MEKSRTITRNQLQKKAVFVMYDVLTYASMKDEADVAEIMSSICDMPIEDIDPYLKRVVIEAIKHINDIIPVYNSMMKKIPFERINRVEQAILLIAYSQFFYVEQDVDKSVVINVAVTLAKTYCGANDYKFVNAVLDKVLNRE